MTKSKVKLVTTDEQPIEPVPTPQPTLGPDHFGRLPIFNEVGQVAIRYKQEVRHMVELGNGHQHVFAVEANICLGWVAAEDVPAVLARKGGCCGMQQSNVYWYANEADIRRWTNKGGA